MALVVGATGGIGQAVAVALSTTYSVWLAGRDERLISELAETLPDAHHWTVDLSDSRALSDPPPQLSELSLLVHCAGSFAMGTIGETPSEVWRKVFDVNLFGVVEITRALLPSLHATRGRIVVVNSTAISGSPAHRAAYASSKAALRTFATALHQEDWTTVFA